MKKTILTVILSAFIISGIMVADYIINDNFVIVKTREVKKNQVKKYINAQGICFEQNKREIRVDLPFSVDKVFVEVGDKINRGQKILKLNKETLSNKLELQSVTVSSVSNDNLMAKINNYSEDVLSPINGIVTKVYVSEGEQINTTMPVMIVSDLDNLIIRASVPESIIGEIYVGQNTLISGESLNGTVKGEVVKIHPISEKNERNSFQSFVTVDVIAENYDNIIPQSTLEIEFEKKMNAETILIPFDSVMFDEERPYVFINNLGYAAKRYVNLGEEYDIDVEVISGISIKDMLVVNPKYEKIKEGDKLLTANEVE